MTCYEAVMGVADCHECCSDSTMEEASCQRIQSPFDAVDVVVAAVLQDCYFQNPFDLDHLKIRR